MRLRQKAGQEVLPFAAQVIAALSSAVRLGCTRDVVEVEPVVAQPPAPVDPPAAAIAAWTEVAATPTLEQTQRPCWMAKFWNIADKPLALGTPPNPPECPLSYRGAY